MDGFTSSTGPYAAGVNGFEGATMGQVFGVLGGTNSTTNGSAGVSGYEGAKAGIVYGVTGSTASATSQAGGVYGYASASTGLVFGVVGITNSTGPGAVGVAGEAGASTGRVYGVTGNTSSANGVGVAGGDSSTAGGWGVLGTSASASGVGVLGANAVGGLAGRFDGNVQVNGNLNVSGSISKGGGSFKIDHPLEPANKYLSHSFVESPDMMNIYNGNVITDEHGQARIQLPQYFEALNRDFRYQLTVIGQFAQAIVQQKVKNNQFTIRTSKPHVEVSWQVTGIRHDAYANAYRIPVEEEKQPNERGRYLQPELFGPSIQQAIGTEADAHQKTDR